MKNLILVNLNYIKSLQINSTGNFPHDVEGNDSGDKVHFCHGCVGAIHLFLLAEELFPGNNYKNVAIKCNNCLFVGKRLITQRKWHLPWNVWNLLCFNEIISIYKRCIIS